MIIAYSSSHPLSQMIKISPDSYIHRPVFVSNDLTTSNPLDNLHVTQKRCSTQSQAQARGHGFLYYKFLSTSCVCDGLAHGDRGSLSNQLAAGTLCVIPLLAPLPTFFLRFPARMSAVVEFFRIVATVMNIFMFLSQVPTVREIIRTKSTGLTPFIPLASMVSNAHIWMVYGWLAGNYVAIFGTCVFGVIVSLVNVVIYYHYTTEKLYARKCLALFGLVIVINSLYAILGAHGYTGQSPNNVRKVVGYLSITSSVITYLSPLEKMCLVFRHCSAVFLPINFIVVGAINSASWVVFSLLKVDWFVFAPNMLLLVLGLLQIALYWVYHPATHPLETTTEVTETVEEETPVPVVSTKKEIRRPSVSYNLVPDSDENVYFVALRSPHGPIQQV